MEKVLSWHQYISPRATGLKIQSVQAIIHPQELVNLDIFFFSLNCMPFFSCTGCHSSLLLHSLQSLPQVESPTLVVSKPLPQGGLQLPKVKAFPFPSNDSPHVFPPAHQSQKLKNPRKNKQALCTQITVNLFNVPRQRSWNLPM